MSNSNIVIIYIVNAPDIWLSERPLSYRILSDVIQEFSHVTLQRIPTSDVETHTSEVKFYDPPPPARTALGCAVYSVDQFEFFFCSLFETRCSTLRSMQFPPRLFSFLAQSINYLLKQSGVKQAYG